MIAIFLLCLCAHGVPLPSQQEVCYIQMHKFNTIFSPSLFLTYLFFLWEVTYFKNCFMIKERQQSTFQNVNFNLISVSLFPAPQALTENLYGSISHFATATALVSSPEGQSQNLGVSSRDRALSEPLQRSSALHMGHAEQSRRSFISQTQSVLQGQAFLTLKTERTTSYDDILHRTPDLVTRSVKKQHAIPCLLGLCLPSRELLGMRRSPSPVHMHSNEVTFPSVAKGFRSDLYFSLSYEMQSIYDGVINVPQSARKDSEHRAHIELLALEGR